MDRQGPPMLPRLITLGKLARRLAVGRETILAWVDAAEFPPPIELPDGQSRWREDDVLRWLAARRQAAAAELDNQVLDDLASSDLDGLGLGELAREIYRVLLAHGGWLHGAALDARLACPVGHKSSSFRRAIDELREAELIASDQARGYRPAEDAASPEGDLDIPASPETVRDGPADSPRAD